MIDLKALTAAFGMIYGPGEGSRICMTVLPGVLKDFQGMIRSAAPGVPVREEYRLEDQKALLVLYGTGGSLDIRAEVIPE